MRKANRKIALSLVGLMSLLILGFQNCSAVNFNSVPKSVNGLNGISGGGNCQLETLTIPVKILFVVDTSGSNVEYTKNRGVNTCDPSKETCAPPTDPNKTFRGGSIADFFVAYESKTNFTWEFEVFSGSATTSYISSGGNPAFGNAAAMTSAINQFAAETDGNSTPYISALNSAYNTLANDPDLHSTAAHPPIYNIIFMSDGYPSDALNSDGSVNIGEINSSISSITALAPGRITLSTAYYGTVNDPVAAGTLQTMAAAGGGQFVNVDTTSTSTIAIAYLITIPNGDCQ